MTEENSYYMDYYQVITWLLPAFYLVITWLLPGARILVYLQNPCLYPHLIRTALQNPCLRPHLEPFPVPQQHTIWHKVGSTHLYN